MGLSLNLLSMIEMKAKMAPEDKIMSVMAKSASEIFAKDFYAFGRARRACRSHTFQGAETNHVLVRLLDSNIWGGGTLPKGCS